MSYITNDLCFKTLNLPLSYNQLTFVNLQGCTSLTTRSLHQLLVRSRALKSLSLKGLSGVTNTTCDIISNFCPNLISLNMSRCVNMDAEGIRSLARSAIRRRDYIKLKDLRLSGLKNCTDTMMADLGQAAPFLEVLDLSYSRQLHNSAIEAFVACDEGLHAWQTSHVDTLLVTARDLGREASDFGSKGIRRRVTRLRHLLLSHCIMLTDVACANLTYSVPNLEFLELAGIGPDLKDAGLTRLLQHIPFIRRLDLEDASEITDAVIRAVTPAPETQENPRGTAATQPGHVLQHLNISYATNVSDDALLALIRNCIHLTALEADNTRIGKNVLKEFVRISRQRKAINARIVAIDCRGISESLVKELSPMTRPRLAFRRFDARRLNYLDARDDKEDELKVGQDECDEGRVVIKTFYSWQTVDAVKAIRDKRRKAMGRKMGSESSNGTGSEIEGGAGSKRSGYARWWSPGRRSRNPTTNSGTVSPILQDMNGGDGCSVM
jgi:F-box/leucine-rich repeat protein 2/20